MVLVVLLLVQNQLGAHHAREQGKFARCRDLYWDRLSMCNLVINVMEGGRSFLNHVINVMDKGEVRKQPP